MSAPEGPKLVVHDRPAAKGSRVKRLRQVLPDLVAIVAPRKWTMILGLFLILVSRAASLAQPLATKYLIDDVLHRKNYALLPRLVLLVGIASLDNLVVGKRALIVHYNGSYYFPFITDVRPGTSPPGSQKLPIIHRNTPERCRFPIVNGR